VEDHYWPFTLKEVADVFRDRYQEKKLLFCLAANGGTLRQMAALRGSYTEARQRAAFRGKSWRFATFQGS
jgi:hypothetical protein